MIRVTNLTIAFLVLAALFATVAVACGDDAEPETIIKEVTKEVPVEVVRTVEVVKTVEVDKIVEVEKIVEVVKEPEPTPVPEVMAGPAIYQMGIFEEPITRNFWNYYGGPGGSVWTQYVLGGISGSLYGYSDQRFDWVPSLAEDFPTPLKKESVGGTEFWTAEVPLKRGVSWSDGRRTRRQRLCIHCKHSARYAARIELGGGGRPGISRSSGGAGQSPTESVFQDN